MRFTARITRRQSHAPTQAPSRSAPHPTLLPWAQGRGSNDCIDYEFLREGQSFYVYCYLRAAGPGVLMSTALMIFSWRTLTSPLLRWGMPLIMMLKTYH